jgi:acyl carrier protein
LRLSTAVPADSAVLLRSTRVTASEIEDLVLRAMRNVNMARKPEAQLQVSADAPLFGAGSPLDSLGLVSLLIDIEEALGDHGIAVTLSDARAMSQSRSPFRSVPALVAYIQESVNAAS